MKKLSYYAALALVIFQVPALPGFAQPEKKDLLLQLAYYNDNNHLQYLKAVAKTKTEGKFRFVPGIGLRFYITADSPGYFLGSGLTNDKGEAVVFLPATAKSEWIRSAKQSFVVVSGAAMGFDPVRATADLTKARLKIDTAGGRKVSVSLMESRDSGWAPVKGVDVKVAVKRLDGNLTIADAPTYTTDSTGLVQADFKRDSLPGDAKGNLVLVASVEDNDNYGNLTTEFSVPWGVYRPYVSAYDTRSLFARRGRSPAWLEGIAYSIIVLVWGVLLYL
ncbi:MAG TPA: hypothetical protein VKQ52_17080, partial [Puia sp.]|nr:hypothetical protein [Puia sp.]